MTAQTPPPDGGPAFPAPPMGDMSTPDGIVSHQFPGCSGMSLRAWFAGQALQGLLANPSITNYPHPTIVQRARQCADLLLAALNNPTAI